MVIVNDCGWWGPDATEEQFSGDGEDGGSNGIEWMVIVVGVMGGWLGVIFFYLFQSFCL